MYTIIFFSLRSIRYSQANPRDLLIINAINDVHGLPTLDRQQRGGTRMPFLKAQLAGAVALFGRVAEERRAAGPAQFSFVGFAGGQTVPQRASR